MPNFKKLAKGYQQNATLALQELVHCPSVYDEKTISKDAPYGAGVKKALDYVAKLGKDYGFKVDSCDGHATEISFGEEGKLVGIYAHADVVPVSGKWDLPPFGAQIKGPQMFGRGTSDDKGPLIAALFAVKLLKDNGLIKGYRVRLVAGGDEERGSSCLDYYFHNLKKSDSDYGFTPDADFPLIYAEKGIIGGELVKLVDLSPIVAIDGGVVRNAVCDKLLVTLPKDPKFVEAFKAAKIDGEALDCGEIMVVTFKGKSAHGSTPEKGVNAAAIAFDFLGSFYKNDYLRSLATILKDPNGVSFNGKQTSPELGLTTYNYGLVNYTGKVLKISLDFRYGETAESKACIAALEEASKMNLTVFSEVKPLLFSKKSPLVATLMKSYKHMTHKFFDKPLAIGGGTYAKEAKNCVAYGSAFKGHDGSIHSPNEYIYLEDFYNQIAIYADAIYRLGHIKA
ncbi:MAG: putative dipeptidase [Tenericutes bacterium ADurb.BinA155]|nr:MAG: putative dipeptidase [Tenericutes bacterium ADurb.BinA155]